MIFLDSTLRKLQVVLGAAVTTTQLPWVASYVDITSTPSLAPASATGVTNSTTVVDMVAAPAASTQRQLKYLNIFNADIVVATVTVQFNDNGTVRILQKATLAVGQALVFDAENAWSILNFTGAPIPTRQVLTSGTTYTAPPGVRQLRVRMLGGGGGGSSGTNGSNGSNGTKSTFNSIDAALGNGGGTLGIAILGGAGGSAGTGTANLRMQGGAGGSAIFVVAGNNNASGGPGGCSALGGGATAGYSNTIVGADALANSGAGGGGGGASAAAQSGGGGGGAGEYAELIINSPAATYTYAIGAGGTGGAAGTGGTKGGNGGSGVIIVDEFY